MQPLCNSLQPPPSWHDGGCARAPSRCIHARARARACLSDYRAKNVKFVAGGARGGTSRVVRNHNPGIVPDLASSITAVRG